MGLRAAKLGPVFWSRLFRRGPVEYNYPIARSLMWLICVNSTTNLYMKKKMIKCIVEYFCGGLRYFNGLLENTYTEYTCEGSRN